METIANISLNAVRAPEATEFDTATLANFIADSAQIVMDTVDSLDPEAPKRTARAVETRRVLSRAAAIAEGRSPNKYVYYVRIDTEGVDEPEWIYMDRTP